MADKDHIYNLKAVVNEVGLSPATLRAWERRYGVFQPQRSAGGHRLYSRQDIEMLKWMVARQNEGLSISRAVELWKSRQGSFQDVLRQFQVPASTAAEGETRLDELRRGWLSECMVFDDQAANQVLDQAFAIAPAETICAEVLQKGLAEMGDRWYAGTASVQHEHFASTIAMRRIHALMSVVTPPKRVGRILAACPPGEEHSLVLLLVSYLLRRQGWDVVYLGANVPLKDLDRTIRSISPVLVISAAQTLPAAASLKQMAETTRLNGIRLAYGGGIFIQLPAATRSIEGFYLGDEITQVTPMVEALITAPPRMPNAQSIEAAYSRTLSAFKNNEALIRAQVVAAMQARQLEAMYLEVATTHLPQLILAALSLGDIQLLDRPITWLDGLLKNFSVSTDNRDEFFREYAQAVERHLGEEGGIIIDFLTGIRPSAKAEH